MVEPAAEPIDVEEPTPNSTLLLTNYYNKRIKAKLNYANPTQMTQRFLQRQN